jgi:hypothetical protein
MKARYVVSPLLLWALSLPAGSTAMPGRATFVSFAAFLQDTATAEATSYLGDPESKVVSTTEFEAMRGHVLSLYEGVQAVHSFIYNAQYVDCVPILQQPGARRLGLTEVPRLPPPALPPLGTPTPTAPYPPSPLSLGQVDGFGNSISCDNGTVPMRRITLKELSRFPTLKDFFRKVPMGSDTTFYPGYFRYRTMSQFLNNIGTASQLNVWYPPEDQLKGQIHSTSQIWVVGYGGATKQTAETGWTVEPIRFGTNAAVPFIYWTANSYNDSTCYDTDCPGFILLNNNLILGVPNWPGPGQPGGQQVVISLQWQAWPNPGGGLDWALYYNCNNSNYNTCIVGYYPAALYGSGQLSKNANDLQFGGETLTSGPNIVFGPMGSGAFPSAGSGYAAYYANVYYVYTTSTSPYWTYSTALSDLGYDDPPLTNSCYGEALTFPGCGYPTNFHCNSFFFGGPGGASCP